MTLIFAVGLIMFGLWYEKGNNTRNQVEPNYLSPEYIRNGPRGVGVRSPCPGLNSMANHGFLPRDGKNITRQQMVDAMFNAYNVDKTFGRRIVNRAYDLMARNNETYGEYLDLDFLNVPGRTSEKALEHDVSLSRGDFSEKYNYDCVNAQPSMIEDLISHGDRNGSVSVSDIINYRKHVECDISRKDPKFTFSTSQRVVAAGEAALYFYLFQVNGKVPSSYTRSFFLEERIPYLEGWKKPGNAISLTNLSFMSKLAKLSFYETTRRC